MDLLFILIPIALVFISERNQKKRDREEAEEKRIRIENETKRKNTPCHFEDGISKKQFKIIVKEVCKNIERLTVLKVDGTIIYGTVQSCSGITEWNFSIDFNDYGHITGQYWINSDNDDSVIPETIAQKVSSNIVLFLAGDVDLIIKDGRHTNANKENVDYGEYLKKLETIKSQAEAKRKLERKRKTIKKIKYCFILAILIFLIGITIFAYYKYTEHQKSIEVGISSTYAVGKDYQTIVNDLENNGFTNIHTYPDYDLEYENISQENTISEIEIHGKNFFDESSRYPYDSNIYIKYHMVKNICLPISAKEAKKMNYNELTKLLSESGFVNIKTQAEYDLITGWINKDGSVDEITINGETKFTKNSTYRPDVEILITYHTFEKNNDK